MASLSLLNNPNITTALTAPPPSGNSLSNNGEHKGWQPSEAAKTHSKTQRGHAGKDTKTAKCRERELKPQTATKLLAVVHLAFVKNKNKKKKEGAVLVLIDPSVGRGC